MTGDNTLIGGFILTGPEAKQVIVRAIGPSLNVGGVPITGRMDDTVLELRDSAGQQLAFNDNWKENQQEEIERSTIPPSHDLESAIVATLPANNSAYTVVLSGRDEHVGIALVEAYDLSSGSNSLVANISSRAFVDLGDNVIIGGVVLGGMNGGLVRVVVRAIGPSLSVDGIALPNRLEDPTLELFNADGASIHYNDNWQDSQRSEIVASGIPPADERESALVIAIAPGNYTAVVRGKENTRGIGVVEFYHIP